MPENPMNDRLWLRAQVNPDPTDDRTVSLVFTTGAPFLRRHYDGTIYNEVLSLNPKHIRLERLNNGAPLLAVHSSDSLSSVMGCVVPGSVQMVSPTEGRLRVKFSRRPDVEPFWQDVKDKIIRNVSVGYVVHEFEKDIRTTPQTWTAIDWEPFEVSLVPIPADAGAQVRRASAPRYMTDADRGRRLRLAEATARTYDDDRARRLRIAEAVGRSIGA